METITQQIKPILFQYSHSGGVVGSDSLSRQTFTNKLDNNYNGSFDQYLYLNDINRQTHDAEELAKVSIDYFNNTLRPSESKRVFIKLIP